MNWFAEGGPSMYAILLLDVLATGLLTLSLILAIVGRFSRPMLWPARIVTLLILFGTALPAIVGGVGWAYGMNQVAQAIEHAAPEHREALEAAGSHYAKIPLWFGLGSTGVLGFMALVPVVIAGLPARGGDAG